MRRTILLPILLGTLACGRPKFDPVLPGDMSALEREVQELIESKAALVRASPSVARAHVTLALVYEANEHWDEAARSFQNAIAIDDSQPLWRFHRGLALHESGQTQAALVALREAGRGLRTDPAVQQRLGHALLDAGEVAEARSAFELALAASPLAPECLVGLAAVEIREERWSQALELTRRALAADPTFQYATFLTGSALQGLGRDDEAREFLSTGMGARTRWLADALTAELNAYRRTTSGLMDAAGAAAAAGNHARAAALYEQVLARKPDDPEAQNNLCACLIDMGQLERAQALLETTLQNQPQSFAVHLNFATLGLRRQDLPFARSHADRAVELGGSVGRTHFMRGYVMMLQEEWVAAERELRATIDLDARNPQYFLALSEVTAQLGRIEEARSWCRKAVALAPAFPPARASLCSLALRAGDRSEARSAFAVLEKIAPSDPLTVALRRELAEHDR